jgi:hypothetical protein
MAQPLAENVQLLRILAHEILQWALGKATVFETVKDKVMKRMKNKLLAYILCLKDLSLLKTCINHLSARY